MKSIHRARVLVAHAEAQRLQDLCAMLEAIEHVVVGRATSAPELEAYGARREADLILTPMSLGGDPSLPVLIRLAEEDPVPAVIVTDRSGVAEVERALEDHVMAYLVEPLSVDDLRPTIHLVLKRFAEFEALKAENADLREALAARKLVERAKGLLMRRHGCDEEAAYRQLQRHSSDQRRKLHEVAEALLVAEDLIDGKLVEGD